MDTIQMAKLKKALAEGKRLFVVEHPAIRITEAHGIKWKLDRFEAFYFTDKAATKDIDALLADYEDTKDCMCKRYLSKPYIWVLEHHAIEAYINQQGA